MIDKVSENHFSLSSKTFMECACCPWNLIINENVEQTNAENVKEFV